MDFSEKTPFFLNPKVGKSQMGGKTYRAILGGGGKSYY